MPDFRFLRSHGVTAVADAADAADAHSSTSSAVAVISSRNYEPEQLISVPLPLLILSTAPLFLIAYISWRHKLELASPVVVSAIRTFVQLSILGFILDPIFAWGIDYSLIVIAYVLFMCKSGAQGHTRRNDAGDQWHGRDRANFHPWDDDRSDIGRCTGD
jgi:hypothetical protein